MESSNLNHSSPEDEAAFEAQMKAHFSAPPLPDEGFSQRVLASLPPSHPAGAPFSRWQFCLGGLVVGVAIAAVGLFNSRNLESALNSFDHTLTQAFEQLCTAPMALALGFVLLSVGYAFRSHLRLLPRL